MRKNLFWPVHNRNVIHKVQEADVQRLETQAWGVTVLSATTR